MYTRFADYVIANLHKRPEHQVSESDIQIMMDFGYPYKVIQQMDIAEYYQALNSILTLLLLDRNPRDL